MTGGGGGRITAGFFVVALVDTTIDNPNVVVVAAFLVVVLGHLFLPVTLDLSSFVSPLHRYPSHRSISLSGFPRHSLFPKVLLLADTVQLSLFSHLLFTFSNWSSIDLSISWHEYRTFCISMQPPSHFNSTLPPQPRASNCLTSPFLEQLPPETSSSI